MGASGIADWAGLDYDTKFLLWWTSRPNGSPYMKRPAWLLLALPALPLAALGSPSAVATAEKSYWVEESIAVPFPGEGREVKAWIPLPQDTPSQSVSDFKIGSPWPYEVGREGEFGNKLLFVRPGEDAKGPIKVRLRYKVTRREQALVPAKLSTRERTLYTEPRGLMAVDKEVRRIAYEVTKGARDPVDKARKLYDYVFAKMAYDKTVPGWGRGDTKRACEVGRGNCTDFHSLFLSLAFASGIPGRFAIGLQPAPDVKENDLGKGYHCWAEFFVDGKGWVPVDISEAWKHPEKKDYFFGRLDEYRVTLSVGRELTLEPAQGWKPLNYFVYPYVEVDGRPVEQVKFERKYKVAEKKES